MDSKQLKNICIDAISAALVSRGKNKGILKAKCPPGGTDAAAAWQALMGHANPYKLGFGHIMFFNDRQRAIYDAINDALDLRSDALDLRSYDRDRVVLELLGAW